MSDMDVQIKITTDTKDAQKNVDSLSKSFENIEVITAGVSDSLKSASTSLNEVSDSTSQTTSQASEFEDAMNALEASINDAAGSMGDGAGSAEDFAKSLDEVEKKAKKLGRDLSTLVTAPIAALAALSLKNVFDLGSIEGSTGKVRSFALAVENMKSTFNDFLLDVGTIIAPAVEKMANALTNTLKAFMSLDRGTKTAIISFSGIAAVVGPLILAFSSISSLVVKLTPLFSKLGSGLGSIGTTITSVITSIATIKVVVLGAVAGLLNLFATLKKAGVNSVEAFLLAFNYLASGFSSKVVAPILSALSTLVTGAGKAANAVGLSFGKNLLAEGEGIKQWSDRLKKDFENISGDIDQILKGSGTNAADAFTFGLSSKAGEVKDKISNFFAEATEGSSDGVLKSEIGKNFSKTSQELDRLQKERNLSLQKAASDHAQRLREIDETSDPQKNLELRIQAERDYQNKKFEIQKEALNKQLSNEILAAKAISNINQRKVAEKEANDKFLIESQKLANEQELSSVELTNQQIEESYRIRYEKAKQYADIFSDGLSDAFITIAEGSKSMGAALEDFARQFLRQVAAMILRATILKAVMSSIGLGAETPTVSATPTSGGTGYLGGNYKFATGGPVVGAGTGTSDSIPAWLSNGEYVIDAKTVSKFGNGFFRGLQSLAKGGVPFSMPSAIPKFADGGLVTGSGQAPQVVIENNGSAKQVASQEFDPKTAITTIVLEDLGRNGPMSRGIQSTFGMKRGGMA